MAKRSIAVLDPTGVPDVKRQEMANRVGDLHHKRLGVLWNEKHNGDILLRRLQEHLQEMFDFHKVSWFHQPSAGARASPEVLEAISKGCDVVLSAVGD